MIRVSLAHAFADFSLSIDFEAPTPGVIALFGPSGSGKSSLLNAVAGLLRSKRCRVRLDGVALDEMPVRLRGIGYVFQDGRLFPHMNVADNLAYGMRRAPRGPITPGVVNDLLGIGHLARRWPADLSGGERQRVAIGRALLSQPRLLLMDEPLSSLDQARREEILPYFSKLREVMGIPILYATHAMEEVTRLADTLVLIDGGRVLAAGPLEDILARVDLPVAAREDAGGVLRGVVAGHDAARGLTMVGCGAEMLRIPLIAAAPGTMLRLRVPAREIIIALEVPRAISVNNVLPAFVGEVGAESGGHVALVSLEVANGQLLARITRDAAERLRLAPGKQVLALIKSMSVDYAKD